MCSLLSPASIAFFHFSPPVPPSLSPFLSFSLFLPDRSDIRNLYYQVCPGCWWKSWFATPDWIYLSFILFQPPASCPSRQEPDGLSTLRCQGIKIYIYRGGRKETEGGKGREGQSRPTCHSFGQLVRCRVGVGGAMYSLSLPIPTPSPLQTFIYLNYTPIYQSANKTCHAPYPESQRLAPHKHIVQS